MNSQIPPPTSPQAPSVAPRLLLLFVIVATTVACTGCATGTTASHTPTCHQGGTGDTTLQALLEGPLRKTPARVDVVVWYRGRTHCGTCPPEALCQPCISMILFSDRADTPPAGWFWMIIDLPSDVVLKEGCAYRLTLKLKGDYRKHLSVRDNNPMYFDNLFDVRIVGIR